MSVLNKHRPHLGPVFCLAKRAHRDTHNKPSGDLSSRWYKICLGGIKGLHRFRALVNPNPWPSRFINRQKVDAVKVKGNNGRGCKGKRLIQQNKSPLETQTGGAMMRWWLKHSKGKAAEPARVLVTEGMFVPQSAETLLAAEHRKTLLARIWQYTALAQPQFDQLYLDPIRRYASYVQQLPASEAHHHAYPGGMLDHGLELMACSLKLRQSHLLPDGSAPEDQAAQSDAWSAAIAYGALLHDIGKIAVDLSVEYQDGEQWHPWHGPLRHPYRFRYTAGRDYKLHATAAGLLYTQILRPPLLDWLCRYPELWGQLLSLLANHYEHAGMLGTLVLQADRVSTAQNIGANPIKALHAPSHSLQYHLLTGLRHLVKTQFKLNQPGAVGWLTEEHLWLVSKTATDKLRAYLLAQAVDGIPSSNTAIFDELQSHGLVDATSEGKAIWRATISDGDWQETFTFLRLQPALVWAGATRPESFTGSVKSSPDGDGDLMLKAPRENVDQPSGKNHDYSLAPSLQDMDYLEGIMDMFEIEGEVSEQNTPPDLPAPNSSGASFLCWLRDGIDTHRLLINDSKAKIHTVDGKLFLVSPGIFQHYASEQSHAIRETEKHDAWPQIQRDFERLNIHLKRSNGQNIWTCQVKGPRKTSILNGYLLSIKKILSDDSFTNNPFLELRS